MKGKTSGECACMLQLTYVSQVTARVEQESRDSRRKAEYRDALGVGGDATGLNPHWILLHWDKTCHKYERLDTCPLGVMNRRLGYKAVNLTIGLTYLKASLHMTSSSSMRSSKGPHNTVATNDDSFSCGMCIMKCDMFFMKDNFTSLEEAGLKSWKNGFTSAKSKTVVVGRPRKEQYLNDFFIEEATN